MIHVVSSFRIAHGKGKEAMDFMKELARSFNEESPSVNSTVMRTHMGHTNTLFIVNTFGSYAEWEEGGQKHSANFLTAAPEGTEEGKLNEVMEPGSFQRRIFDVID